MLGVPLVMEHHLLWADDGYRVASEEDGAELPGHFSVDALFCLFEDDVDVDVEGDEGAEVLSSVLEFDDDALVARAVECV